MLGTIRQNTCALKGKPCPAASWRGRRRIHGRPSRLATRCFSASRQAGIPRDATANWLVPIGRSTENVSDKCQFHSSGLCRRLSKADSESCAHGDPVVAGGSPSGVRCVQTLPAAAQSPGASTCQLLAIKRPSQRIQGRNVSSAGQCCGRLTRARASSPGSTGFADDLTARSLAGPPEQPFADRRPPRRRHARQPMW